MKILLASGNAIYDKQFRDTQREQTGFAIMIRELATLLPMEGDTVDVITHSNFTRGHEIGGSNLVKKTWFKLFTSTKLFYIKKALYFCRKEKMSFKMKLRTILYFMTASYTEKLIKKNKYDVVHINGIGSSTTAYMYACVRTNTPFVITLHGLNSFSSEIKAGRYGKKIEREFFIQNKNNPQALSTVISTGIKRRLCNVVGKDIDEINVVCNPVIKADVETSLKYSKTNNEKIIVTVGNISENKNQRLIVDAFAEMCRKYSGDYKLFVIGGHESALKAHSSDLGLDNVVFTGTLERKDVYSYYSIADLCIMASKEEGFGLSLVEGYSFGVPCVMPRSIDAFDDLYNEDCCVPAKDYEVSTFAEAMHTALNREWNKEKIIKKAKEFSEENCAAGYLNVLRRASEFKSAPFDMDKLDELVDYCLS